MYENTWQVSILRSDKAAVTHRGHGQYKAKTGDRIIIEIFQVSCQLQGQTRLLIHFFSVSYCPFNLADFCDSMEIWTWAYIFSLDWNQWGGCFLFKSFLSGDGWISCLRNNQEDGRNQAYFPRCIFLSVNKKKKLFQKRFWLCVLIHFWSICPIFEKCQSFDFFSIVRSGWADLHNLHWHSVGDLFIFNRPNGSTTLHRHLCTTPKGHCCRTP